MCKPKPLRIPYSNTTIQPERTKADITKLLEDHGIKDHDWMSYRGRTTLKFIWALEVKGVQKEIMFMFSPPEIPSNKRVWTGSRTERVSVNLIATAYRLLWHYLKNKLEAVRWGLESMEKEFLSHAVVSLPDGSVTTVGEKIEDVYEAVRSPALEAPRKQNDKIIEGELVRHE